MEMSSLWSWLCWWRNEAKAAEIPSAARTLDPQLVIMPSDPALASSKEPLPNVVPAQPTALPVKAAFTPRLQKQLSSETIANIVVAAQSMPAFPTGAAMVMSEINAQDPSPARVATAVRMDPVLTAVVLRAANSPLFSPNREITNLEAAINTLGLDTLHTVVLHHALAGMVRSRSVQGGYDVNMLWQHSLAASVYAGALAKKCRNVQASEAVTAALIHDLGKVVVNAFSMDRVRLVLDPRNARLGESLLAREERYLEASHNVYGAVLARHWQLPDSLCLAIELHHHTDSHKLPDVSPRVKELAAIVFAANQFAKLAGFHGNDKEIDWADSGLLEQINLPYDIVAAFEAQPANLHNKAKMLVGL